ncbi:MAG: hypothetical protein MUC36_08075 [Planctomycetes bacterium]|jgi:hypothetical protein|nr:hypothetical protein [Planctomycetota bacterium]
MIRPIPLVSVVSLLASLASAQCFNTTLGSLVPNSAGAPGVGDDVVFDVVPMNFAFPINGSTATFTHAQVSTNGVIYLTNGTPSGGTNSGYPSLADVQGIAGAAPRIAPMWIDLDFLAANNGGVYINNPVGGPLTVTWQNAQEWDEPWPVYTIQAQLFSNGNVVFVYGGNAGTTLNAVTAVSAGNGITATASVDLSAGGNAGTTDFMYEQQPFGVFDLGGRSVTFTRNAGGGYTQTTGTCVNAFHQKYGNGCYDSSDSFYQFFPDASTAPAALNGQSMVMTFLGTEYLVQWGGAAYVPPTAGAVALPITDDSETSVLPSLPLPTPSGPQTALFIHGNGMISAASNNAILPQNYAPDPTGFLNAPATAFFSWHDYNTSEGGQILYEEVTTTAGTIAYITWDNVENYSVPAGPNPSTLQFQLNLTTGTVSIVWVTIDGNNTSAFGSGHLIGYSTAGPSSDPGSINLATTPPFVTSSLNSTAIELEAAPAPVSTASSGTAVTYTTTEMPEFVSGSGLFVGLTAFSLGQIPGGFDLGVLGAPGCSAYVQSLDFTLTMVGTTSTNTVLLSLPAGVPQVKIFAQSVALTQPGVLNAFGLTVSNGILSQVAAF